MELAGYPISGCSRSKDLRLWTLHPCYLDARGLVALWREALLAQAVLGGKTRGYTRHPQLVRFRDAPSPLDSIASYLAIVHAEATLRGYRFDATKIAVAKRVKPIQVTRGQIEYEWEHLVAKLRIRSPEWLATIPAHPLPEPHPLFRIVPGVIADWEIARAHSAVPRNVAP